MRRFVLVFAITFSWSLTPSASGQPKPRSLAGPKGSVWTMAFSSDGKLLAAASDVSETKKDDKGKDVLHVKGSEVTLWDVQKGEVRRTFTTEMQAGAVAFSPDGKLLAVGSFKLIQLFDVETGQVRHALKDFDGSAKNVQFTADGKQLLSNNSWFGKSEIRVWEVQTGKLTNTLQDSAKVEITGMALSADGKTLVTSSRLTEGGFSGEIKVRDFPAGTVKQTITDPKNWINNIALSPDGKSVAAPAGFGITVWDTATGKPKQQLKEFVSELAFLPGGKTLAGAINSGAGSDVKFIDVAANRTKQTIKVKHEGTPRFTISPDGKWLAIAGGEAGKGEVQIHDISRIK